MSVLLLHAFWIAINVELNKSSDEYRYVCIERQRKEMWQNVYNW